MPEVTFTPLLINGQDRPSSDSGTFEVRTPYTGILAGNAASATSQDCKDAIDAASKALKTWETSRLADRRDIFLRAADLFASDHWRNLLAQTIREEIAPPSFWDVVNISPAPNYLRAQTGLLYQLRAEYFPSGSVPGAQVYSQRRAKGVLLAIAPWNAPVNLTVRAIAVPILCGNTIVFKGSELTPRSHYLIAKIFHEAGLPNGVLNCISASRENNPSLVSEIIAHPQVRHFNFTGGDRVGRILAMEAAKHLKPCVLELGGKAPAIILKDADLDEAVKAVAFGAMAHSGQVCMSTERVIVHKEIAEKFLSLIRGICEKLKAGEPSVDSSVKLGPLFSEESAERFVRILRSAQEAGAEVVLGDLKRDKTIVQPHILRGVKPGMALWDEESFGPVFVFSVFDTIEEAIEMANASTFSLTSSVWSSDILKAQEIAFQLRYGFVNINGSTLHAEPTEGLIGLGGSSGYGRFDVEFFTDKRTMVIHPKGRKYPID